MFEFDYTVTEKDYMEFNRYHAQNSPAGKKSRNIALYMMLAALLLVLVTDIISGNTEKMIFTLIAFAVMGVFVFLLLGPMMRWNVKLSTRIMKKSGRLPYDKQVNLRFEDDLIIEKTPMTEVKTSYASLERIAVGKEGVYLYNSAISAILIPNTVFSNAAQKFDFLQFIHEKTNLPISDVLS